MTNIEDHQEIDDSKRFLLDMGKRNIDDNSDRNIRLQENLTEHRFETEYLIQNAAIDFVHVDMNYHRNDMNYMLHNVITFHRDINVGKIQGKIL